MQHLFDLGDASFVALIEDPLLELLRPEQAGVAEQAEVLATSGLAHAELLGDQEGTNPVLDQVAITLRREMRLGVTQPIKDQETLVARKGLQKLYVDHASSMALS